MRGLLVINLGTPNSTKTSDIKRYLGEFLMDPKVIDLPWLLRWLLVNLIIVPFRAKKSGEAYKKIWTKKGSPLLTISESVLAGLNEELGDEMEVKLAMRYGKPSIKEALDSFAAKGIHQISILPLYPQYATATVGSALEKTYQEASKLWNVPNLHVISPFFADPEYIQKLAESIRRHGASSEHLIFSFHGLPERHIKRSSVTGSCLTTGCCNRDEKNLGYCYKAQSHAIAAKTSEQLGLTPGSWTTSFQSRLGKDPWLGPDTETVIKELGKEGKKEIFVVCPSFLTDCLETLEEIAIQGQETFAQHGGESLTLIPCLNDDRDWIKVLAQIARGS